MVLYIVYIAGADYGRALTTLHFRPDHSVAAVVQVKILDDVLREGEERFTVELTAFDLSVVLVNSITEVVIDDDDKGKFKFTTNTNTVHYERRYLSLKGPNTVYYVLYRKNTLQIMILLIKCVCVWLHMWPGKGEWESFRHFYDMFCVPCRGAHM